MNFSFLTKNLTPKNEVFIISLYIINHHYNSVFFCEKKQLCLWFKSHKELTNTRNLEVKMISSWQIKTWLVFCCRAWLNKMMLKRFSLMFISKNMKGGHGARWVLFDFMTEPCFNPGAEIAFLCCVNALLKSCISICVPFYFKIWHSFRLSKAWDVNLKSCFQEITPICSSWS